MAGTGMTDWDLRFLDLAEHIGSWSKDPSTKVGAMIVRPDRTILSVGYNGFPRGVIDYDFRLNDRPIKYAMTVHAEPNALLMAAEPAANCALYVHPFLPCADCAGLVIQSGIARVVSRVATPQQMERWGDSFQHTLTMFEEAGVLLEERS
jgi:dCMP deaminase